MSRYTDFTVTIYYENRKGARWTWNRKNKDGEVVDQSVDFFKTRLQAMSEAMRKYPNESCYNILNGGGDD